MNRPEPSASSSRKPVPARTAVHHSRARTALGALVAALVVGILGMHALADHGTSAAPAGVSSVRGTTSDHDAAAASGDAHDARARTTAHTSTTTTAETGPDPGSGSGHGMGNMVMLCVVMLAAAALTLLALLVVGVRPRLPAAFQPAAVRATAMQWVRGTGPPYVWQFSVIRC